MILMDAMALLYRSHFAFGPDARLRTSTGEDTSALFGFLNTLLNILELQPHPTHFAVIFDAPGKNFRHELFPGYKGQRPPTPEPISEAVPRLKALLQMAGVPQISAAGVEADDVIGTIAIRGIDEGFVVAIASPDKDFFQLLRKGLILLRPPSKADKTVSRYALLPYTEESFRNDWELYPEQFVDVLALAGDSSDNVPGVAGIGPKRAVALLHEYGSLENILENSSGEKQHVVGRVSMPKKVSATLASREGQEVARLSKLLVQINTKLDLPPVLVPLEEFRLKPPADAGLAALEELTALEFKMHGPRLKTLWAAMGEGRSGGGSGVVGRE
jgi:DNA polymerase-1